MCGRSTPRSHVESTVHLPMKLVESTRSALLLNVCSREVDEREDSDGSSLLPDSWFWPQFFSQRCSWSIRCLPAHPHGRDAGCRAESAGLGHAFLRAGWPLSGRRPLARCGCAFAGRSHRSNRPSGNLPKEWWCWMVTVAACTSCPGEPCLPDILHLRARHRLASLALAGVGGCGASP